MPKHGISKNAFTLIEVMVAVMIVSVVIAALLQMQGNTSHKFINLKKMMQTNQYNSFLLSQSDKYGFEESNIDLYRLVGDFDLESDLRRRLQGIKLTVDYKKLDTIDTSEFDDSAKPTTDGEEKQTDTTGIVFEIGKSILKADNFSTSLIRVRIQ